MTEAWSEGRQPEGMCVVWGVDRHSLLVSFGEQPPGLRLLPELFFLHIHTEVM